MVVLTFTYRRIPRRAALTRRQLHVLEDVLADRREAITCAFVVRLGSARTTMAVTAQIGDDERESSRAAGGWHAHPAALVTQSIDTTDSHDPGIVLLFVFDLSD